MKHKLQIIIILAALQVITVSAQRDPSKEILVFFSEEIGQSVKTINGKPTSVARLQNGALKSSLIKIGIEADSLKVALPEFNQADTLKLLPDGRKLNQPNMTKLFRYRVPQGKSRKDLIDQLNKLPGVLYAELNGRVSPLVIPTDSRFGEQWGLRNTLNQGADIHAEAAWNIYTGNPNNIIGIADGGTDVSHPDLDSKIAGGETTYGWNGHGIYVSGIAAAESNNSQGVTGVDWNAKLYPIRVDNKDMPETYTAIVNMVNYSPNLHVLNCSWDVLDDNGNPGVFSITVAQAFAYAYKANRTSVVSAGNHQLTHPDVVAYPAGYNNVIAVGATNDEDIIANFSAHGNHIDVVAPGVDILSTYTNNGYDDNDGTSFAAPFVSGVASLLKGYNTNLSNDDVENIIRLSADKVAGMGGQDFTTSYGFGRLNAERALNLLRSPNTLSQWSASGGTVSSSSGNTTIQILGASGLSSANYIVKRYEVRKIVTFPQSYCSIIGAWGRGVSTSGWSQANPNFGEGFCEIVPGSLTNTGATLRTYVYEIWNTAGAYLGYYPSTPANVVFAYSVLGVLNPTGTLSGPTIICSSGATFTVNNPSPGCTVLWEKSLNLNPPQISGNTAVFTPIGNGAGWVRAIINSGCGSYSIPQKNVWVGEPLTPVINSSSPYVWSSAYFYPEAKVFTIPLSGDVQFYDERNYDYGLTVDNFQWNWSSDGVCCLYDMHPGGTFFYAASPGTVRIRTYAQNQCGTSYMSDPVFVEVMDEFYLYPNPASDNLLVTINESQTSKATSQNEKINYNVRITNAYGTLVYSKKETSDKFYIPTSNFINGTYFIEVSSGKKTFNKQFIVKH